MGEKNKTKKAQSSTHSLKKNRRTMHARKWKRLSLEGFGSDDLTRKQAKINRRVGPLNRDKETSRQTAEAWEIAGLGISLPRWPHNRSNSPCQAVWARPYFQNLNGEAIFPPNKWTVINRPRAHRRKDIIGRKRLLRFECLAQRAIHHVAKRAVVENR